MATVTMRVSQQHHTITITTMHHGKTTKQKRRYPDTATAELAIERIDNLDFADIVQQAGVKSIRVSKVYERRM